jgi:hypothetical protein
MSFCTLSPIRTPASNPRSTMSTKPSSLVSSRWTCGCFARNPARIGWRTIAMEIRAAFSRRVPAGRPCSALRSSRLHHLLQCRTDARDVGLAGLGEAHAARGPLKQLHPQAGFQLPDRLAQRRRRDLQFRGRPGEPAVLRHLPEGDQSVQLVQLHIVKLTFTRRVAFAHFSLECANLHSTSPAPKHPSRTFMQTSNRRQFLAAATLGGAALATDPRAGPPHPHARKQA